MKALKSNPKSPLSCTPDFGELSRVVEERGLEERFQISQGSWHPAVAAYIQEVTHHLRGSMPKDMLDHVSCETAFWLEREARDLILEGANPDEAYEEAVRSHDKPRELAARILEDYFEGSLDSPVANGLGRANSVAGAVFGITNVLYLIFLQLKVFMPVTGPIDSGLTPGEARSLFPEPLPNPDFSWQFFVTLGYPLIAPIFCGWICGRLIPVGVVGAIYRVMALVLISALLLGVALLPDRSGVLYAVLLAVYWLPVGCLAAHISSSLFRRSRRKKVEGNG